MLGPLKFIARQFFPGFFPAPAEKKPLPYSDMTDAALSQAFEQELKKLPEEYRAPLRELAKTGECDPGFIDNLENLERTNPLLTQVFENMFQIAAEKGDREISPLRLKLRELTQ